MDSLPEEKTMAEVSFTKFSSETLAHNVSVTTSWIQCFSHFGYTGKIKFLETCHLMSPIPLVLVGSGKVRLGYHNVIHFSRQKIVFAIVDFVKNVWHRGNLVRELPRLHCHPHFSFCAFSRFPRVFFRQEWCFWYCAKLIRVKFVFSLVPL